MTQTTDSYRSIEWSDACLAPPGPPLDEATEKRLRTVFGYVPDYASGFSAVPWLLEGKMAVSEAPVERITADLRSLILLVVSQDSSCRYCYGVARSLLQIRGMSDASIRRVEQNLYSTDMDDRTKAALEFVRKLSRANPRPGPAERRALEEAGWDALSIEEIALTAASVIFQNRAMTLSASQPAPIERFASGWRGALLGPIARIKLAKRRIDPPSAGPLADALPFRQTLGTSGESLLARVFGRMIEEALASGVLPRRSKAILFAVIGKSLGCGLCEKASLGILREEGIEGSRSQPMLDRLSADFLDERESAMISVARHTIRSQPIEMQAKMESLKNRLEPAELIEFIGVAALANALARLSCLHD